MTLLTNTAEGLALGTVLGVGNSAGGGNPANSVNGTNRVANLPAPRSGSKCYVAESASSYFSWSSFTASGLSARAYYYCASLPSTASLLLCADRSSSAGARIGVLTNGRFIVQGTSGTLYTAPADRAWPTDQWVRLELQASGGGNASSGVIRAAAFLGESTNPYWSFNVESGANTGTGALTVARFGRFSGGWQTLMHYDDAAAQDSMGFIGPTLSGGWRLWDGTAEQEIGEPAGVWNGTALAPVTYTHA